MFRPASSASFIAVLVVFGGLVTAYSMTGTAIADAPLETAVADTATPVWTRLTGQALPADTEVVLTGTGGPSPSVLELSGAYDIVLPAVEGAILAHINLAVSDQADTGTLILAESTDFTGFVFIKPDPDAHDRTLVIIQQEQL